MIKVLQVLSSLTKRLGDFNVVYNYFNEIDKSRIRFDFLYVCESDKKIIESIVNQGSKCFQVTHPRKIFGPSKFVKELREILKEEQYDYIHLHVPIFHTLIKKAKKNLKNTKLIIHAHSTMLSVKPINAIRNRILLSGIDKDVDGEVACSVKAGQKWFGKNFLNKNNTKILKNALDFEKFKFKNEERSKIRKNLGIDDDEIAFCHTGRFSKEKNHAFLIDVFCEVYKRNNRVKLFLFGTGYLEESIKENVNHLNMQDNIFFMGQKPNIEKYLNAMDVFLFPSIFEGLGLSLIEAQVNGLLCFASSECPKESNITKNVFYIDLKKGVKYWSDYIVCRINDIKFMDRINVEVDTSYDIKNAVNELTKYYEVLR